LVRRRKRILTKERSSTELRFASFPFSLCWRGEPCQGSPMNALRAPLTGPAARREKCCYFSLDGADVVIEEMLQQLRNRQCLSIAAILTSLEMPCDRRLVR